MIGSFDFLSVKKKIVVFLILRFSDKNVLFFFFFVFFVCLLLLILFCLFLVEQFQLSSNARCAKGRTSLLASQIFVSNSPRILLKKRMEVHVENYKHCLAISS